MSENRRVPCNLGTRTGAVVSLAALMSLFQSAVADTANPPAPQSPALDTEPLSGDVAYPEEVGSNPVPEATSQPVLPSKPPDHKAQLRKITEIINQGKHNEAIEYADSLGKQRVKSLEQWRIVERSRAKARLGRTNEAEKDLRAVADATNPMGRLALYNAACYASLQNNPQKAMSDLLQLQHALVCRSLTKELQTYAKRLDTDPDLARVRKLEKYSSLRSGFSSKTPLNRTNCR